jgi:hypothetical protein
VSIHPAVERLLLTMPWLTVVRAPLRERGRYYPEHRAILVRHGLRGPQYDATVAHEALHAVRGDEPCVDGACEARQEARCDQEVARLLIDLHDLADAAAAYGNDGHLLADELGVEYEVLATRVRHLHPSERAYLHRRLEHTEESA